MTQRNLAGLRRLQNPYVPRTCSRPGRTESPGVAEFVECDPIYGRTADHQRQRRGDDEGDRPPTALRASANPEVPTERYHGIAIGLIGGLFDIFATWSSTYLPPDPAQMR